MHPHPSTTRSAGRGRTARTTSRRSGALPPLSERHTEAYLLARDTVRRIQRTTSLVEAAAHRALGNVGRQPVERHQGH